MLQTRAATRLLPSAALLVCVLALSPSARADAKIEDAPPEPAPGAPGPDAAAATAPSDSPLLAQPQPIAPPPFVVQEEYERPRAYRRHRAGRSRSIGKILLGVGSAMVVGGWLASLATYGLHNPGSVYDARLLIPFAGPWMVLASTDQPKDELPFSQLGLALLGVLQTAGAGLALAGGLMLMRDARQKASAERWRFLAAPIRGGGFANARLRF